MDANLRNYIDNYPEEYAKLLTEDQLVFLIQHFSDSYYNEGTSGISDNSFDALVWCLKKKSNKSYEIIGAEPRERMRSELPFFAPSLNKVKVGNELTNFIKTKEVIVAMDKLDGVSGIVEYQDGVAKNVYLRGNGKVGSNISYVLEHISFPHLKTYTNMVVRGEFVMSKKVWSEKYCTNPQSQTFTTSRNFVCGKLNSCTASTALQDIRFVAYDIMYLASFVSGASDVPKGMLPCPSESLKILQTEGFEIVNHARTAGLLTTDIVGYFSDRRTLSEYPIDGIVLAIDKPRKVASQLENPSHTVAFKAQLDEQIKITEVTAVDWRISRHGRLVPVVEFKPVFIEGRRLSKATGHNARRCIETWKIGLGTKIQVTASGGIIPKIVDVVPVSRVSVETGGQISFPPSDPAWKWQGCDIVLIDIEGNSEVQKKRLVHFFKELNIPGIREGMIARMFDGGLNTLQLIVRANEARLRQIRGIGPKKSVEYRKSITERLPHSKMYRLMYASNCFEKGLGKVFMRQIAVNIPTFLFEPDNVLQVRLRQLKGIGPKRCSSFIEGIAKFRVFVQDFPGVYENNRSYFDELSKKGFNRNIAGRKFVFTSLENDNLEDYILDHQGSLEKAVGADTAAVISGNPLELTPKIREARSLGIRVYTVSEFQDMFGFTC